MSKIYDLTTVEFKSQFKRKSVDACDAVLAIYGNNFLMNNGIENAIESISNDDSDVITRNIVKKLDIWRQSVGCSYELYIKLMRYAFENMYSCFTEDFLDDIESVRVQYLKNHTNYKPTPEDIINHFGVENNKFYKDICEKCFSDSSINIFSKPEENYVKNVGFFDFNATLYSKASSFQNVPAIFINDELNIDFVFELVDLVPNCAVFCNKINESDVKLVEQICKSSDIKILKLGSESVFETTLDLMNIFGCELFDSRFDLLRSYKFGKIKNLVRDGRNIRVVGSNPYTLKCQGSFSNKSKYLSLNGKTIDINVSCHDSFNLSKRIDDVYEISNFSKTCYSYGCVFGAKNNVKTLSGLAKTKGLIKCFDFLNSNIHDDNLVPIEAIDRALRFTYLNIREFVKCDYLITE